MPKQCAFILIIGLLAMISVPAQSVILEPGAQVQKLAGGFKFTEGPTADQAGNVYFTDQPNDRIMMWSVEGRLTTFLSPSGRSNGLYFDRRGYLLACADAENQLWMISPGGKSTVLVKDFAGRLLNGPNDDWSRKDGGIYFTDPLYPRGYWSRSPVQQQDGQHVYFLSADRRRLLRVAEDLEQPNGIIGTPDGKRLYVSDIKAKKTYCYRIQKDGQLADKRLFCDMGSDGMTLDAQENLYLTGQGVTVFSRSGQKLEQIAVPERWTANVCFGGKDRRTLFITASTGLYSVRTRVKGAHSPGK